MPTSVISAKMKNYGDFERSGGVLSVRFNSTLGSKLTEAFQTSVHEFTHYADYISGNIAEEVYKEALKNLGLRVNSKEAVRLVGETVGLRNQKYWSDPTEILAYSAERVSVSKGNKLANEIIRLFEERVRK